AQRPSYDYTAFKESKPTSILVLPPLNHSPDVKAGASLQSQITLPLAESGYYVLPVAVTNETFRQNGVTEAADIHALPIKKLHEI
ncbi:GNA1162 family protein, partial [Salmonella enterica]